MKKEYLITGALILGLILFLNNNKKSKKNSEYFFSATGTNECGCGKN